MPKKKEEIKPETAKPIPQLTFTEEEHKDLVDFANFINKHVMFNNISMKQTHEFAGLNIKFVNHIKKVHDHIFEHKRTVQTKKAD